MPQKRNPISCCYIHAAIRVVRQHAAALMDAMVADHERSTGPWEIEWIVLPEAFCLIAGALKQSRACSRAGGRRPAHAAQHRHDHGLVMSEAVMMGLGPYIGREYAHDLVYDMCRESLQQDRPLIDLLAAHPEIRAMSIARHWSACRSGELPGPVGRHGRSRAGADAIESRRQEVEFQVTPSGCAPDRRDGSDRSSLPATSAAR